MTDRTKDRAAPRQRDLFLEAPSPGSVLEEELIARGWTQADFAAILGRPARLVNEIIKAKRAITPETAHAIGEALKTGPEYWMGLESAYRLSLVRVTASPIAHRAQIYGRFRVRELQKRGWIPDGASLQDLEAALLAFFGMRDLDAKFSIPHAAKRSSYENITVQQAAWLARARQLAARLPGAGKYSHENLDSLYSELRKCVENLEDLRHIPPLLSEAGIRLVILEPLPASKIDGACLWLTPDAPVVALSLRYDRHDIFCHALWHELDHIEHNDGQGDGMLDVNLLSPDVEEWAKPMEDRANRNAADRLVAQEELDSFIAAAVGAYSEPKLVQFARKVKVHPGVVLGQLQHMRLLPWSAYSHLRSKVRHVITQVAPTDGFGLLIK